ncbi:hypothetical protein HGRIS_005080 [Hohenbuehelia grisea]|uniref:SWI5-dependent HO expression protein 3 n=1 Tax=Hohenbuehelia grisea TaxID=104357 RepID=A0ABR3JDX5_9AGAR
MATSSLPDLPSPLSPPPLSSPPPQPPPPPPLGASMSHSSASASSSSAAAAALSLSVSVSPPKHSTMHGHVHSYSHGRDRSLSRPSSRTSIRSGGRASPAPGAYSSDDPVALRTQMSTIKHSIRQQQAHLQSLETQLLRGPRPLPPEIDLLASPPGPAPPSSYSPISGPTSAGSTSSATTSTTMKRRSSFDVLQGIAGPDSGLPLPSTRNGVNGANGVNGVGGPGGALAGEDGIREGVPMSFGVGAASPTAYKRVPSPTRTLSRIPVASVGNARALAEEGNSSSSTSSRTATSNGLAQSTNSSTRAGGDADASSASLQPPPPSPNRRASFTPGGTTKVLADLQTGVINARTALENTKAQLRLSQRTVAQLTRLTEDLKEGRERLRLENEGLNNVVARKERLLQEVLERARKAEAEAAQLKAQLKSETSTSKRAMREMEATVAEATAVSSKSEREYLTLRDSVRGLVEGFKTDTDRLKEEVRRREERWRAEAESVGAKYRTLVEEVKRGEAARALVKQLREEDRRKGEEVEKAWTDEILRMKEMVETSGEAEEEARSTARELASELGRLRRLMQRDH